MAYVFNDLKAEIERLNGIIGGNERENMRYRGMIDLLQVQLAREQAEAAAAKAEAERKARAWEPKPGMIVQRRGDPKLRYVIGNENVTEAVCCYWDFSDHQDKMTLVGIGTRYLQGGTTTERRDSLIARFEPVKDAA